MPHPYQNYLLLFGGFTGKRCLNDVWLYNLRADEWTSLGVLAGAPSERAAYGCALMGNKILILGGFETAGGCVTDSFVMHVG